jgi:hypothetical protein
MFLISIPLKHIILDPAKPVDLSTMPEQDAIELIRKSYSFLSPAVDLFIDHLFGGRTDYAAAYRSFDHLAIARIFLLYGRNGWTPSFPATSMSWWTSTPTS